MKKLALGLLGLGLLLGCDSTVEFEPHRITVVSYGVIIRTYESSGAVYNNGKGEYQFRDKETGKIVRVTGDTILIDK